MHKNHVLFFILLPIVGHHDPPVLLDKVGEIISGPVELDIGEELRRIARDCLAPVLTPHFLRSPQNEFPDEAEGDGDRAGPDGAELVARLAEVLAAIGDLHE